MTIGQHFTSDDQREIMNAFQRCPEFIEFTEKEKLLLLDLVETQEVEQSQQVFSSGETGEKFFVVIHGQFSVRLKSNVYKKCISGDIFGEIAVFSEKHRLGTVQAMEPSKLIVFNSEVFFNPEVLPVNLILKLVKALTKKMIGYFYQEELLSSREMIKRGESESTEFKKNITLKVREPIVRTLSAFMNLNGGAIFIGVNDNGEIMGIHGNKSDFDRFKLNVQSMIRSRLGTFFNSLVHFEVEEIYGKKIMRIDCDSSESPVFFKKRNKHGEELEEFVVRTGPANTHLKKGSEIIRYCQRRYKN